MKPEDAAAAVGSTPASNHQGAMLRLLNRPLDEDEVRAATLRIEQPLAPSEGRRISLLAFRLGDELLGLPAAEVARVTPLAPVHRVPHRTTAVVRGICHVEGELLICVSLSAVLEIPGSAAGSATDGAVGGEPDRRRMIVLGGPRESWAFAADEVLGVVRLASDVMFPPPATVQSARHCFTDSLASLSDGRILAVLDTNRLDTAFRTALS